jgi:hypothetical protein
MDEVESKLESKKYEINDLCVIKNENIKVIQTKNADIYKLLMLR